MGFQKFSEPARIEEAKISKEGNLIIIPLVKNNQFGSVEYGTIDFVLFDTTTLKAKPNKLSVNYHKQIEWSYDVT